MIYIDMDGVLAIWNTEATPEDTQEPGYFLDRDIEQTVKDLIDDMLMLGMPISILSAVWNEDAARDKDKWLDMFFDDRLQRIFVPYGENKADYIVGGKGNILIDDHTDNLISWEKSGNKGIKFLNDINGKSGRWKGASISNKMTPDKMLSEIAKAL